VAPSSAREGLVIGVDASRNRSGGAMMHLKGVLGELDPERHGIREVHLWSWPGLVTSIPDRPWLIKHSPSMLEGSLPRQLWWQARYLAAEIEANGCDILYTTDAATVCTWKPMVVFSQDLLSYEPRSIRSLGISYSALRAAGILFVQNAAFRRADGVIFLTRHAASQIQQSCGPLSRVAFIPHGVNEAFRAETTRPTWPRDASEPIRCVYVSPIMEYKHQWNVVAAVASLRERGHNVTLTLIGSGSGPAAARLQQEIERSDPHGEFVTLLGHVAPAELPRVLSEYHLYLFASSVEAFGITLLEGMALGLPIVCSNRSSLPETLRDGGVYCDPLDPDSIASATESLVTNPALRERVARRGQELSGHFSWKRCAAETFDFITETARLRK
jgi:glycosyltransferase involved in cell wall biosynthesis